MKESSVGGEAISFVPPSMLLLLSYFHCLRNERMQKFTTVEHAVKCLSMSYANAGHKPLLRTGRLKKVLDNVIGEDKKKHAKLFHPELLLPKMHLALWSDPSLSGNKKMHTWAHFLVQFAITSRASDVC